jgi:hypothetical protein
MSMGPAAVSKAAGCESEVGELMLSPGRSRGGWPASAAASDMMHCSAASESGSGSGSGLRTRRCVSSSRTGHGVAAYPQWLTSPVRPEGIRQHLQQVPPSAPGILTHSTINGRVQSSFGAEARPARGGPLGAKGQGRWGARTHRLAFGREVGDHHSLSITRSLGQSVSPSPKENEAAGNNQNNVAKSTLLKSRSGCEKQVWLRKAGAA